MALLQIITEIILTPSLSFLGEDIGKKEFLSPRETFFLQGRLFFLMKSVYFCGTPVVSFSSSVTNLLVCFCNYGYVSYQKE